MSVCGGWSLAAHTSSGTKAITLWCRSWSCVDCMPFRLAGLKKQASDGQPTTFLTLTVNPARGQSPEHRARELVDAMKLLFKRAARKFQKSRIEYMAVFEETKRGEPHLHMLMRAPFIPQKWISDTMNELIQAPIVDIRRVNSVRAAAQYVAKYVSKGPKGFGSLKRYWATPGYDLSGKRKRERDIERDQNWWVIQEPLFILAQSWQSLGRIVVWVTENEVFSGHGDHWRDRRFEQ